MPPYLENKKAYFNYEITEKIEAGISLFGFEVKAVKAGRGSIVGSYIIIRGNEAFLVETDIPPYQPKNAPPEYDPKRVRKLLLTKKEIARLIGFEKEKGLTIIPLSLYSKHGTIKVEIGIGKGKKIRDKRETIKRRETDREIRRTLKRE
jgi:SsrA-binding protein